MPERRPCSAHAPIRVLIVDDSASLRSALRACLQSQHAIDVIGEAGCAVEAVDRAAALRPDVILMDVRMPGLSGADAIRAVLRRAPDCCVLSISASADRTEVEAARRAGAAGWIEKRGDAAGIARAIIEVYSGRRYVSPHHLPRVPLTA